MSRRRRHPYRPRVEVAASTLRPAFGSLIVCHFDDACDPNPNGPAAYGAIVRRDGRVIWQASEPRISRASGCRGRATASPMLSAKPRSCRASESSRLEQSRAAPPAEEMRP
jgi:hypothetical protein